MVLGYLALLLFLSSSNTEPLNAMAPPLYSNDKTYTSLPNLPPVTVGAVPEEKENFIPCPLFSRVPAIGVS